MLISAQTATSKAPDKSPHKLADKLSKAKKILDLQSKIHAFRASEQMVKAAVQFGEKDPRKKPLKDQAVAAQVISDIEEAYITYISQNLNEKDLDYLIALYSSPMYQTYMRLERDFWVTKSSKVMNEKLSLYQKNPPKK